MGNLTPQNIIVDGLNPVFGPASGVVGSGAGSDSIIGNDTKVALYVKNDNAGAVTVTITSETTSINVAGYGVAPLADISVAIPAGEERVIGPFTKNRFDDASGDVSVSYTEIDSVTVAALRLA